MKRLIMLISILAFFAVSAAAQNYSPNRNGKDFAVSPMMNYRQMSDHYDYRLYQPSIYDKYSPAGSAVASFFIPGLGQAICGEWGRGFAWFGSQMGTTILMLASALTDKEELFLMASAATLALRVGTIVDGARVAKVKNMYLNDLRAAGYYGFEMDIYPSVNYVRTASGIQPTAGMTLALRF